MFCIGGARSFFVSRRGKPFRLFFFPHPGNRGIDVAVGPKNGPGADDTGCCTPCVYGAGQEERPALRE